MKKLFWCCGGLLLAVTSLNAQVISQWTFETSVPASAGPFSPEIGSGSALGSHAGAATYSSPAGNGSSHSFSANTWAIGDYYQFQTSTLTYSGIKLEWDQTSSNTGPGFGHVQYSTDGTTFTPLAGPDYAILANAAPNPAWNSVTSSAIYHYIVDVSSITALNNAASVWFRLVDPSNTSANGGTVATAGTDRVDNFTVEVIPEPQSILILSGLSLLAWNFRRQRR